MNYRMVIIGKLCRSYIFTKNDPYNTQKKNLMQYMFECFFSELNDKHIYGNNIFLSIFFI